MRLRKRTPTARPLGVFRGGAACVELAICLPIVILLVFASLEGANMLFLRQSAVQAAYEAAKATARSSGSQQSGRQLAEDVLAARNVTPSSISFSPANVESLAPGTPFTVTVSVPSNARTTTGIGPFGGLTIEAEATMQKE